MNRLAWLGAALLAVCVVSQTSWADSGPPGITGTDPVEPCAWPATMAVRYPEGSLMCSGSLVHPRVVLTAAHCPVDGFGITLTLGEDVNDPVRVYDAECEIHPTFVETDDPAFDVAVCVLDEAIEDVVPIPPLMGCEADVLQPGAEIEIVGYGAQSADLDPDVGWESVIADGLKRSAVQVVESVTDDALYLLGEGIGACPGDSGGPALVQLADGTWRVLGAGARLHPDSPLEGPNDCGYGAIYSTFAHVMPWIEATSGFDVTPCHDSLGGWNPDARCTGFPLSPGDPDTSSGTWLDGCAPDEVSGLSATCGPAWEDPDPTPGGESSSDDGGLPPPPPLTTGPPPPIPPPATTVGDPMPGGTSTGPDDPSSGTFDTDTDTDAALLSEGLVGRGCGCRSSGSPAASVLLLLLCVVLAAPRRPSARFAGTSST